MLKLVLEICMQVVCKICIICFFWSHSGVLCKSITKHFLGPFIVQMHSLAHVQCWAKPIASASLVQRRKISLEIFCLIQEKTIFSFRFLPEWVSANELETHSWNSSKLRGRTSAPNHVWKQVLLNIRHTLKNVSCMLDWLLGSFIAFNEMLTET